jgi:extracellular factor (EF) 3-hydroxypalmitic acid methyl ester biosynthesis protein
VFVSHDAPVEEPASTPTLPPALETLTEALRQFAEAERAYHPDTEVSYQRTVAALRALATALHACEQARIDEKEVAARLEAVRLAHSRSEFCRRVQTWPRGYPGDWETIDYVLDGVNRTPRGDFAHHLERYALACAASQQHRNKVAHQAALCERALTGNRSARILSIACGGSRDLAALVHKVDLDAFDGRIWLNDADASALHVSMRRLAAFHSRCTAIPGSILTAGRDLAAAGPFDLVLAGGLFDYLPRARAIRLVRTIYRECLSAGGTFFFTNMAIGNPHRLWMELVGGWRLIERDEAELRALCVRAGVPDVAIDAQRDATGLAWLIHVRKPADADFATHEHDDSTAPLDYRQE